MRLVEPGQLPLGIRDNNPGNLEVSVAFRWQGEHEQSNGHFCVFDTPENGIRALIIDLHNSQVYHHLNSIDGLIRRFAPPNENDTTAYVRDVAAEVGLRSMDSCDVMVHWLPLVKAIIRHENGQMPYTNVQLVAAYNAAFTR